MASSVQEMPSPIPVVAGPNDAFCSPKGDLIEMYDRLQAVRCDDASDLSSSDVSGDGEAAFGGAATSSPIHAVRGSPVDSAAMSTSQLSDAFDSDPSELVQSCDSMAHTPQDENACGADGRGGLRMGNASCAPNVSSCASLHRAVVDKARSAFSKHPSSKRGDGCVTASRAAVPSSGSDYPRGVAPSSSASGAHVLQPFGGASAAAIGAFVTTASKPMWPAAPDAAAGTGLLASQVGSGAAPFGGVTRSAASTSGFGATVANTGVSWGGAGIPAAASSNAFSRSRANSMQSAEEAMARRQVRCRATDTRVYACTDSSTRTNFFGGCVGVARLVARGSGKPLVAAPPPLFPSIVHHCVHHKVNVLARVWSCVATGGEIG